MSEAVRKLYDEVFTSVEAVIQWVEEGNGESPTLEYKVDPSQATRGSRDADPPHRLMAREATAFANTEGGIIIWGVEQKGSEEPPRVVMLTDPIRFCQNLISKTQDIASPQIRGLDSKPLLRDGGEGFVVTYVPASDDRPHMAMATENRYFVRSGESASVMLHRQVQDAMLARKKPSLILESTKHLIKLDLPGTPGYCFELRIRNVGLITAKNLALAMWNSYGQFRIASDSLTLDNVNQTIERSVAVQRWRSADLHPFESRFGIHLSPDEKIIQLQSGKVYIDIGLFADDFAEFYRKTINPFYLSRRECLTEDMFEELHPVTEEKSEVVKHLSMSQFRDY